MKSESGMFVEDKAKKTGFNGVACIIPAGGYSSRMKDFKPLLPLGSRTILESTVKVFLDAGIDNVTVVVGYRAEELIKVLDPAGIQWIYNDNFQEGMYSSVLAGVRALSLESEGFFLMPVDMPLVKKETIQGLLESYEKFRPSVVYPVFKGIRGHPPFISSRLIPYILSWSGDGGLRALLAQYSEKAVHVEVEDEGILADADTPEDYLKICSLYMSNKG